MTWHNVQLTVEIMVELDCPSVKRAILPSCHGEVEISEEDKRNVVNKAWARLESMLDVASEQWYNVSKGEVIVSRQE